MEFCQHIPVLVKNGGGGNKVFSVCTSAHFSSYFESNLLNAYSSKNVSNKSRREE